MKTLLWLDDERDPRDAKWSSWIKTVFGEKLNVIWAKDYDEFTYYFNHHPVPDYVSFDHDLGEGKSGTVCAHFLCDLCQSKDIDIPDFAIQSSNWTGAENIRSVMHSYHKVYIETHAK